MLTLSNLVPGLRWAYPSFDDVKTTSTYGNMMQIMIHGSSDLDPCVMFTVDSENGLSALMTGLPTSKPSIHGQLWRDGEVVKIVP
jgi:hypothetical protein